MRVCVHTCVCVCVCVCVCMCVCVCTPGVAVHHCTRWGGGGGEAKARVYSGAQHPAAATETGMSSLGPASPSCQLAGADCGVLAFTS